MFSKIKRYISDPKYQIGKWFYRRCPNLMPDKWYLEVMWQSMFGTKIDWKHPRTLNEKLQWLKLYNRNPFYTTLVDKYRVKEWVAEKIGSEYVIPTLAVYNYVDEIDLDKLPDQFVLKCNHDSGSVVICKDKATFDLEAAKKKLANALSHNYFYVAREWPYKDIKRCIFAEQYMESSQEGLVDYKFYFYGGDLQYFMYSVGEARHDGKNLKFNPHKENIDYLFKNHPTLDEKQVHLPSNIDEMIELSRLVANKISAPHLRVDMFNIRGKIYLGEFTFYSSGGILKVVSSDYAQQLADLIVIEK